MISGSHVSHPRLRTAVFVMSNHASGLVIVSTTLELDEIEQVTDAVSSCTRILALESVILPKELLCVVRLMLG